MSALEERVARLESQIEHLENLENIRSILARYCKALDDRDAAAMSSFWAKDAVLLTHPWLLEFHGAEAIVNFYSDYFKVPERETRHNYSNEIIERSGESYTSFSYFNETMARGEQSVIGWGTYADVFCREDGMWKFRRREITVLALTPINRGWAMKDKVMSLVDE